MVYKTSAFIEIRFTLVNQFIAVANVAYDSLENIKLKQSSKPHSVVTVTDCMRSRLRM